MSDASRDDRETGLWFRDRLQEAVGLGFAGLVVLAGWLVSSDSVISLEHPTDRDHREAARLVLAFVPILWGAWYAYLVRLRRRCPEHATVMPRRLLHAVAWFVALALAVLLYFVAVD